MTTATLVEGDTSSAIPWYRSYSGREEVWYDATTVYEFFKAANSQANAIQYRKSTDAGATWSAPVNVITSNGGGVCFDIYYERWTDTGFSPYVHVVVHDDTFGGADRGVYYNRVDLSSGSLLNAGDTNLHVATAQPDGSVISVVVSRAGNVHIVGRDSSNVHFKSTNHGSSWSSRTALGTGVRDLGLAVPDGSSADTADILVFFISHDLNQLYVSAYDDSADSWANTLIDGGWSTPAEAATQRRNLSAAYDRGTGHNLLCGFKNTTAPHDLVAWDTYGTTTTAMVNVLTNAYANSCCAAITSDGNARVAYSLDPDGTSADSARVYYKESTDFSTWGTQQDYSTLGIDLQIVRVGTDPSPNVAVYMPTYWTDITGIAPLGYVSDIYVEVPPADTTPPAPSPVQEEPLPGVILRALYMEGVAVNSSELTLERAPSV